MLLLMPKRSIDAEQGSCCSLPVYEGATLKPADLQAIVLQLDLKTESCMRPRP